MKEKQEQRKASENQWLTLLDRVQDKVAQVKSRGIKPTEIYLGPKEAKILEVEMNWQDLEGRLIHTQPNTSALLNGDMEGGQLMGMRIRLTEKDGVSVSE